MKRSRILVRISVGKSHPSRVRGLKLITGTPVNLACAVAPLAGAWIETALTHYHTVALLVAPLAGAWIETSGFGISFLVH